MPDLVKSLFIVFVVVAATSCKQRENKQAESRPMPYAVVQVPIRTVTGYQTFPANIEGKINSAVRAKISGYIQALYVDEGETVVKGQPLFRLETNTLTQTANAAKSGIAAAESNVHVAQVEVNKLIPLVEKNIVSTIQLETAKANLTRAESQLAAAKADYESISANIEYSIIRSPISGRVGALPFKAGSLVGPADPTPLTEVSDNREVYVYFSMNEKAYFDFLKNSRGETIKEKLSHLPAVSLRLANNELYDQEGKIEALTGQVDRATGTIRFRALFDNKNGLLSNGNSGTIMVPIVYHDVLVVPETSTFEQQGIVYVYAVKNDTAKSTAVNVVDRIDRMVIINSGVKEHDQIIAVGLGTLRNGAAVIPEPVKFDTIIHAIKSTH